MKNAPDSHDKKSALRLRAVWDAKAKSLGLTQEEAANRLGWDSQSTVSQYLTGRIPLNAEALLKFARLLEVQPKEIDPAFDWHLADTNRAASAECVLNIEDITDKGTRDLAEELLKGLIQGRISAKKFQAAVDLLLSDD